MKVLSILLILILGLNALNIQSPHGDQLKFDCSKCHVDQGWEVDVASSMFDHNETNFALEGQHLKTECIACHATLVFSETKSRCVDCHTDMHQQILGFECGNCHNTKTWIIENAHDLHLNSRFPLLGVHAVADCSECHKLSNNLQFEALSVDCYACHTENYLATTEPNHVQEGYSTNCTECHNERAMEWSASGYIHDFFPLKGGHFTNSCSDCHLPGTYKKIPSDCVECHLDDYNSTDPSHVESGFSTSCVYYQSTEPNWEVTSYKVHDSQYFPVYSGKHRDEWSKCIECHTQSGNYSSFSCTDCHGHRKLTTNIIHFGMQDYAYNSDDCFSCHLRGNKE